MKDRLTMVAGMVRFNALCLVVTFLWGLLLVGCSVTHRTKPGVAVPPGSVTEVLPMVAGIVYREEFRSYQYIYHYGFDHVFDVGPASVSMFDALFEDLFVTARKLENFPPVGPGDGDVDFVLEFSDVNFSFSFGYGGGKDYGSVTYEVKLWSVTGELLTTWSIYGVGTGAGAPGFALTRARSAMDSALIDAREKFVADFRARAAGTKQLWS